MDTFSKIGETMLLAQQGNRELAHAIAAGFSGWLKSVKGWLAAMPTSLPPTEMARETERLPTIG